MSSPSIARIQRISREKCEEWAQNPTQNPITGRTIQVNNGVYNALREACARFGIRTATGSPAADGSPPVQASRLPARVQGEPMPQTRQAWVRSGLSARGKKIATMILQHNFLSAEYVPECRRLVAMGQLAMEHHLVPAEKESEVAQWIVELNDAISDTTRIRRARTTTGNAAPLQAAHLRSLMHQAVNELMHGTESTVNIGDVYNDIELLEFRDAIENELPSAGVIELTDLHISLEALRQEVVLEARAGVFTQDTNFSLAPSRERSLPGSISQRKERAMKPKRSPGDPDEYYPWVNTVEDVPTERSRFRSHAKLSQVSPGPQPSPDAAPLAPLTVKKRTAILAELRTACTSLKDAITHQRFDRMNKKNLQLIVQLGANANAAPGTARCYYVRNLYQLWSEAARNNRRFADPLTRQEITQEEKDDVMRKVRHLRPNAPDPRNYAQRKDNKLSLQIQEIHSQRDGAHFYHLAVKRPFGRHVIILFDLGLIPANIEMEDVGGDANSTSAAIIGMVQQLFERGRLLLSNTIPFRCCAVNLQKPLQYWVTPEPRGNLQLVKGVNIHRVKALAAELYSAL